MEESENSGSGGGPQATASSSTDVPVKKKKRVIRLLDDDDEDEDDDDAILIKKRSNKKLTISLISAEARIPKKSSKASKTEIEEKASSSSGGAGKKKQDFIVSPSPSSSSSLLSATSTSSKSVKESKKTSSSSSTTISSIIDGGAGGTVGLLPVGGTGALRGTGTHKPKRPTSTQGNRTTSSSTATPAAALLTNRVYMHGPGDVNREVTRTRTSFEKELLDWDFLSAWEDELTSSSSSSSAATTEATAANNNGGGNLETTERKNDTSDNNVLDESTSRWTPVPDTFASAAQYVDVWFPLLLQEMQAETLSEVTTEGVGPFTKVYLDPQGGQPDKLELLKVTKFANVDSSESTGAAGGSASGGYDRRKLRDCYQYDLVLLVRDVTPVLDALAKQKGVKNEKRKALPQAKGILGMVNPFGRQAGRFTIRVSASKWMRYGAEQMYGCSVKSLISSIREITSLLNVGKMPLLTRLLNGDVCGGGEKPTGSSTTGPQASPNVDLAFAELGEGFGRNMMTKFNPSQLTAIKAAATNIGFTLIKGPPGTGKTTTLKGLLNSIHLREYQRFYKGVIKVAQADDIDTDKAWVKYKEAKPHILVTAPSNVAVDNIVLRIMEDGFIDGSGQRYNPSLVRMGRLQSERVRAVSLDHQVEQLMAEKDQILIQRCMAGRSEIGHMQQALAMARYRFRVLCRTFGGDRRLPFGWDARVDEATGKVVYFVPETGQSQDEFPTAPVYSADRRNIPEEGEVLPAGLALEELKDYQRYAHEVTTLVEAIENKNLEVGRGDIRLQGAAGAPDRLRSELETNILDSAHLVFTTLNTAGTPSVLNGAKFHIVVVDEAAQAIEPSTLIPLQTGATTCVLVGDPQQLPATVFSQLGASTAFERSLFERLEHGGHPVHLLDTQYRMHPKISAFPRKHFYGSLLKDGPNVFEPKYQRSWHQVPAFQPFTFLDLKSDTDRSGTGVVSYRNTSEARLLVNMYQALKRESQGEIKGKTGIITPYQLQLVELHNQFQRALGPAYQEEVELNTVDGYQGKEKDVIMISCVRAGGTKGIGFLADVRRMNVGLTRGKLAVLVVGRHDTLSQNRHWRALLDHAQKAHALIPVPNPNVNLLTLKPLALMTDPPPPPSQPGLGAPRGQRGGRRAAPVVPPLPPPDVPPTAAAAPLSIFLDTDSTSSSSARNLLFPPPAKP